MSSLGREMRTWSAGAKLLFRSIEPPVKAANSTDLVGVLVKSSRAEGGRPRFKLKTGTSGLSILAPVRACPIVAYGPGDSSLDHTPDQHLDIEEFRRGVDVLDRALEMLCT